jgi:AcrR family transcriptional regulator
MSTSSRSRILEVAHELFYSDGFHNVGLDRILHEVGVTKTTFYNHFESKDDLVLEVLRMHDRWWRDTFQQLLRKHGGDTPPARRVKMTG